QERSGDAAFGIYRLAFRAGQKISGNLVHDKLVVGHIAIEPVHNPIPVAICFKQLKFARRAVLPWVCLVVDGVAHHVEPVPCPALPVGGGSEQTVHDLGKSSGRCIAQKCFDLVGGGRQASQVKARTSEKRPLVGGLGWRYAVGFQLGQDESVDQ